MPPKIFSEPKILYESPRLDATNGNRVGNVRLMLTKFGFLDIDLENCHGDYATVSINPADVLPSFDTETIAYLTSVFHTELVKRVDNRKKEDNND